ncbi:hypothetical protein BD560DRAFT_395062 [Blakeslea trispora]|nr:hypothetical protein BD560DRAFT_395062 [Blakeslea trispora]
MNTSKHSRSFKMRIYVLFPLLYSLIAKYEIASNNLDSIGLATFFLFKDVAGCIDLVLDFIFLSLDDTPFALCYKRNHPKDNQFGQIYQQVLITTSGQDKCT